MGDPVCFHHKFCDDLYISLVKICMIPSSIEDKECIKKFLESKDNSYFEHLYNAYFEYTYYIVKKYNSNREDIKDILQNAWTKTYYKLETFRGGSTFKTWLTKICLNESYNFHAKHKKHLTFDDSYIDLHNSFSHINIKKIDVTILLSSLSKIDRELLLMKYIHGYSYEELSEIHKVGLSAIKMKIKRIKDSLIAHHSSKK